MAYLHQDTTGVANCTEFLLSMWFQIPAGTTTGWYSLIEFGETQKAQPPWYWPSHWNKLGSYGYTNQNVPGNNLGDAPLNSWSQGADGSGGAAGTFTFTHSQTYFAPPSNCQVSPGSSTHVGPGGFAPWDPPPIYYDPNDPTANIYGIPSPYNTYTWPWAWTGNYDRFWGSLSWSSPNLGYDYNFSPQNPTYAGVNGTRYGPTELADLWELGYTQNGTTDSIYNWLTSYIGVNNSNQIGVQIAGAPLRMNDGNVVVPYLWQTGGTVNFGQWHHLVVVCKLSGSEMLATDYSTPGHTLQFLLDGALYGSTSSTASRYDYSQPYTQLDHDPVNEAPTIDAFMPDNAGSGIPVNGKPISLPHYPDAADDSEVSSNYDYPAPIKRRYGDVQMWFGEYADLSDPATLANFVNIANSSPANPSKAVAAYGTPNLKFIGDSTKFHLNGGSGGSFVKTGGIANFAPAPSYT